MLTQCPNPQCQLSFEVPDQREGKNGPCPSCGQVITFRSMSLLKEIALQHEKRIIRQSTGSQNPSEPARFSVLLEDIRSLWNVGSIFRSADGAGFGRLYLCGITGCPPHKSIAKTSLGAEDHVAWSHHRSAFEVLPELAGKGVQIVALEKNESSEPLDDVLAQKRISAPMCLVVGNEVAGISAETLSLASVVCHLPMRGIKASLNVAVAFGIAAYDVRARAIITA
jgi:tRNA G18 (ribose-2'-O)-methylase SpoU